MSIAEIMELPRQERLAVMERLWDSLCRDAEGLESPAWHGKVLDARKAKMDSPEARYFTLEEVRKRLS